MSERKIKVIRIFSKIFIVLSILGVIIWGGVYAINYMIGEEETVISGVEEETIVPEKKDVINAFVCGISDNLTDTMIYVRYEVSTGKLAFMSIPRDTYITNQYAWGHKLNSIHRGFNIEPLVKQVEDLLDVEIDYYVVVDTKIVREIVDAIGGVKINVPFRMKYDDYEQKLHIDLQPGLQVLNGKQAEHFVRFRQNNGRTIGYRDGDIGRTKAQQEFIKEFIKQAISAPNIIKIPDLVKILFNNTDTNVTVREALRYATDIKNIKVDDIYSFTAVGTTPTIDRLSYFKMDEVATRKIIKENFITKSDDINVDKNNEDTINEDTN